MGLMPGMCTYVISWFSCFSSEGAAHAGVKILRSMQSFSVGVHLWWCQYYQLELDVGK